MKGLRRPGRDRDVNITKRRPLKLTTLPLKKGSKDSGAPKSVFGTHGREIYLTGPGFQCLHYKRENKKGRYFLQEITSGYSI